MSMTIAEYDATVERMTDGMKKLLDELHACDWELQSNWENAEYSCNSESESEEESKNNGEANLDNDNSSGFPSPSFSNFASTPSTSSLGYYPSSPCLHSNATRSDVSSDCLPSTPSLRSTSTFSGSGSEGLEWDCFVTMFMAARTEEAKRTVVDQVSRRYRTMETASLRLQKESKGYLDSLRGKQTHSNVLKII